MIQDAPYGVSGAVGTLGEDTKLDENSVCGVGKGVFWAGKSIARD